VVIAVVLVLSFAAFKGCELIREAGEQAVTAPIREAGEAAAKIAARFKSGTITTTFVAAIPHLSPDDGMKLELVSYEATESFRREDDRRVFFDLLPLGTTVTEIRAPVTYRYHLRLDEPWQLDVKGHCCLVHAPRIRPTLPPAIHTDRMEKHLQSGWLRFDDAEQMDSLEQSLTPLVSARAGNRDHLQLVREQCRVRVAGFVRNWLLMENQWREEGFSSVVVAFADEDLPATESAAPTLHLETTPD